MSTTMMKCGHAANAEDNQGNPSCAICFGIHPGADVVDDNPPDLSARTARCTYYGTRSPKRGDTKCTSEKPSDSERLAFFSHTPDKDHDSYYCGCWGWD